MFAKILSRDHIQLFEFTCLEVGDPPIMAVARLLQLTWASLPALSTLALLYNIPKNAMRRMNLRRNKSNILPKQTGREHTIGGSPTPQAGELEQKQITDEIEYTNQRAEPLAREKDPARLFRYFCSIFDASKFNYVFFWAAAKVDYSRSTARGQWYMKQVWANVAVQVNLYLDIDPETQSQLSTRFWNEIVEW
ncbi:uncharacterized protein N7515_004125 [Penicillium bovifimosum]|uniref:Uncharacterized protein n=1 Tax=Penicillium bovifimosum TaxID=126998 RepID=A0A9W9H5X5_9EURO|nr:uncharacterized protein N7515_004125 [Penicillium bovifimosum]KAJ5139277.1 hypothetical protein N7515_004125 [Penicillium bovifimosum]